jgi:hypothetical protein
MAAEQAAGDGSGSSAPGAAGVGGHVNTALVAGVVGEHGSARVEVTVYGLTDAAVREALASVVAEVAGVGRQVEALRGEVQEQGGAACPAAAAGAGAVPGTGAAVHTALTALTTEIQALGRQVQMLRGQLDSVTASGRTGGADPAGA